MLKLKYKNHIFLIVLMTLLACGGEVDHSGRYVGNESISQNGISENSQVTLDLTQNQSNINGSYSSAKASGTLVGAVNSSDENRIESISLTLTSKENYVPLYMQNGYSNPQMLNGQPTNIQMNQQAYAYQQQMNAQNPNGGLYGIPNSFGVNCSGTYTGELLANENKDRLVGNLSLNSSDICGSIVRSLDLRRSEQ